MFEVIEEQTDLPGYLFRPQKKVNTQGLFLYMAVVEDQIILCALLFLLQDLQEKKPIL